jgi:hypothetical protein
VAEGGGDAGVAGQPQDGDGEVPQGGHDLRGAGGADLGPVLVVIRVADPRQAVFDGPVAADDGGEPGRAGLGDGQRGDRVASLAGPFLSPRHDQDDFANPLGVCLRRAIVMILPLPSILGPGLSPYVDQPHGVRPARPHSEILP